MFYIIIPNTSYPIFILDSQNKVNYFSDDVKVLLSSAHGRKAIFSLRFARYIIKNYKTMPFSGPYARSVNPNDLVIKYFKHIYR